MRVPSLMPDVHFLPYPYRFRCPFGTDGQRSDEYSLAYIDQVLGDPESGITKPALIIVEPVQGEGGVIPASIAWLRGLREITLRHDIPLVVDEIQTGFGRTGEMFAFEHAGIEPDAILISKAIGGGFPLSAVIYNERYDAWSPGSHAGTFRGNQVAMVAGSAFLDVMMRDEILANVRERGKELVEGLGDLALRHASIGEVRGRGLMLGIELVNSDAAPNHLGRLPADGEFAKAVKKECLARGLIVESGGRQGAVIRLLPPLNISAAEVKEVLTKLANSFDSLRVKRKAYA